jgi:type II secretory pathway pseudopilin PulG
MRLFQSQLKYSCVCSAWSLLELLIVLALMAILASLGLPQIYSTKKRQGELMLVSGVWFVSRFFGLLRCE